MHPGPIRQAGNVVKIAVPTNGEDLDAKVADRLAESAHLILVETDTMHFEVFDGSQPGAGPGEGIAIMTQAVEAGAKAMLVGYIDPAVASLLEKQGLNVVMGVSGSVSQAVTAYLGSKDARAKDGASKVIPAEPTNRWGQSAKKGVRQLYAMVPRIIGVVLLLGLVKGFVTEEQLFSLFPGKPLQDAMLGSLLGSVLVGNPVNSYVIGDSLLHAGVSLTGSFALMMAWVTVGVIQLPLETEALGLRFTVTRNLVGFITVVVLSFVVGILLGGAA